MRASSAGSQRAWPRYELDGGRDRARHRHRGGRGAARRVAVPQGARHGRRSPRRAHAGGGRTAEARRGARPRARRAQGARIRPPDGDDRRRGLPVADRAAAPGGGRGAPPTRRLPYAHDSLRDARSPRGARAASGRGHAADAQSCPRALSAAGRGGRTRADTAGVAAARGESISMRRLALAFIVLLVLATPAFGDDAGKKHQLDAKISSLQGRLAASQQQEHALRGQVADYTSRIRTLESKVGDVSLRLQTLEADLALHQRRLDALNALFTVQTKRFVFLKQQYATSIQVLDRRLVDIYESDPATSLDVFLGARSVQDAIDQVQYLNDIGEEDRRVAQEVATAKAAIRVQRAKTKKLRKTVQGETAVISARTAQTRDVRDELVGAKNDLSATRQQKLQDISHLNSQQQAEASEIDALQVASAAIAERIRAAQAARAAAEAARQASTESSPQASSTDTTPSSSGLIWPVSGPITSPFGWRWGRMHQGIDIGVGYGTPIHAAASGTIIYCGWESGYGNLTVIDHGGNLATAYGHQSSIAVACGQHVNQGDVIGFVGCTGHCFGPHLHFEVRIYGAPVDPLGYL